MIRHDARSKYDAVPFSENSNVPNPYFQEYLNKENADYLEGYDWAVEQEAGNFFANIKDLLENYDKGHFIRTGRIDEELLSRDPEAVTEEDLQNAGNETIFLFRLKQAFLDHMEDRRDELVTSMIESMSEEDYRNGFRKVWGKDPEDYDIEFTENEKEKD